MICYVYIVQCPDCADEPFEYFDQAKACALDRIGQKPVISQVAIDRNDYGECIDSEELGQVWSWEDEVQVADEKPVSVTFHKSDLEHSEEDPEFAAIDNSVDYTPSEAEIETAFHSDNVLDRVPDNFRKPIPEGMTIEQLVEEMEENEDDVECRRCKELFDKSDCVYDRDYGWLCPACQRAVYEHGGDIVVSQPPVVDEKLWYCVFDGRDVGTVMAATEAEALEKMQNEYPEYHYGLYDGCFWVETADEE